MKKHLLILLLSSILCQLAFSNSIVSNTSTTFTLNNPCGFVATGTYTVQLSYFDFSIGDWVPGPDNTVLASFSNVQITIGSGGDVLYDFSSASPVPNFPSDMSESQGWIRVGNTQMNWDNHQLNCPSFPVTLISFTAQKSCTNCCTVNISFTTADEIDMTQYVVERNSASNNVINMPIGYITPFSDGQGHPYSITDSYPFNGTSCYRLKMVGLSGYVKYSQIVTVSTSGCTAVHPDVNCSGITISGPGTICGNFGDYALTSNPSYTVNNWSWYSNDYSANLSDTYGPSTRVTKNQSYPDGQVELRSFRTGCTFGTQYNYKQITIGNGSNSGYYYANYDMLSHTLYRETYGDNHLGQGGSNYIKVENPVGTQTWEEIQQYSQYGSTITWNYSPGGYLAITMPSSGSGWILFKLTVATTCGSTEVYYDFWSDDSYRLTPNPASSEIVISTPRRGKSGIAIPERLKNKTLFDKAIRQVIIVDRAGRIVMHKAYGEETKQVTLNTSSLRPDFYIARIFNGKTWEVMKFIKK